MATVPLSGTNISLLSGIPFSNDYNHTRWFDTVTQQQTYFNSQTVVYSKSQSNFQRVEGYNFISVEMSIDSLWGCNYIKFQNTDYNNKWFYGFVTKLEYKQRNTTWVHFEIDVLQTWMFDLNFKPSYVVREHCKLWNSDGTPVINTIDEGLNYGTEYDNVVVTEVLPTGYKWMVILAKNPLHNGSTADITPTVIGTPQPLTVYLLPFSDDDTVPGLVDTTGAGIVLSKPSEVLKGLYANTNAQNDIVSIYVTDYTGIASTTSGGVVTMTNSNDVIGVQIVNPAGGFFNCLYAQKVLNFQTVETTIGSKYGGYKTVTESKLLMAPYTQLVLDDFRGNRVAYKSEYINNSSLKVLCKGSVGVSNKTSYGLQDYNWDYSTYKAQVSDEHALINTDPNDIPVITDLLAAYMQGHKNSLNNQRAQIEWHGGTGIFNSIMSAVANPANIIGSLSSAVTSGGNMYNELAGINAKLQDINNQPPSINKMGSNSSYTIGNNYNGVFVIQKQIKDEYITKLQDFFGMFGYKVNEVKLPNLNTRSNWNYVQTKGANITGNFNHQDLQELKAIFDRGITLWHTDDVLNYDLTNGVI